MSILNNITIINIEESHRQIKLPHPYIQYITDRNKHMGPPFYRLPLSKLLLCLSGYERHVYRPLRAPRVRRLLAQAR